MLVTAPVLLVATNPAATVIGISIAIRLASDMLLRIPTWAGFTIIIIGRARRYRACFKLHWVASPGIPTLESRVPAWYHEVDSICLAGRRHRSLTELLGRDEEQEERCARAMERPQHGLLKKLEQSVFPSFSGPSPCEFL